MPVTRYPLSGGGTDWSKYAQHNSFGTLTLTTNNVYEEIVDIAGAGFLSLANVLCSTGSYESYIKVTIDGVVIHESKSATNTNAAGIACLGALFGGDTLNLKVPNDVNACLFTSSHEEYPFVDKTNLGQVILPKPIFFSTSLKIEVAVNNVGSTNAQYGCLWGVEA